MADLIEPSILGAAIAEQLGLYREEVVEKVNAAGEKAIKKLVQITRTNSPVRTGDYRKSITHVVKKNLSTGDKQFVWGAKAPHYRQTHLLVNGHATTNGDRVPGNSFLSDALESVLPEYQSDVEDVLGND